MNFEYFYTFMQSNLLEVPAYFLFYRSRMSLLQVLLIVTLANACTHPSVFFAFMGSGWTYLTSVLAAESFAVFGEASLHAFSTGIDWRRSLLAATFANLFSWQVAPILTYLFFF